MAAIRSKLSYFAFPILFFLILFGTNLFHSKKAWAEDFPFQISFNDKGETCIIMKLNYNNGSKTPEKDFFSDPANVLKAMALATPNSAYISKIKQRPGGLLILSKEKDMGKVKKDLEEMLAIFNSTPSKKKTNFFISVLALKDYKAIKHLQPGSFKLINAQEQLENRQLSPLDIKSFYKQSQTKNPNLNQQLVAESISQNAYYISLINNDDYAQFRDYNKLWKAIGIGAKIESKIDASIFKAIKSPDNKKVAFIAANSQQYEGSWPRADWNLYIASTDGNQIKKITNNKWATEEIVFYWSPDGKNLFYHQQDNSGVYNLYVTSSNGIETKQLTKASNCVASVVSPNGQKVAFIMNTNSIAEELYNLWAVNVDGSQAHLLAKNIDSPLLMWSPDNSKLAFIKNNHTSNKSGNLATLGIAYADNSKPARYDVAEFSYKEEDLDSIWLGQKPFSWSKNSNKLIFTRSLNSELANIYLFNLQNESKNLLIENKKISYPPYPLISTDGKNIIFLQRDKTNGNYILWTAKANGQKAMELAVSEKSKKSSSSDGNQSKNVFYTFSPDGNRIAFISNDRRIWVINLDRSGFHEIFNADKYYADNKSYLKTGGWMNLKNIQWSSNANRLYFSAEIFHPNYSEGKIPYASGSWTLQLKNN